ncbi:MAG: acyl-ACP--UDP-N-acetylglucosamine O-acyltransferase [Bernardetiaceae bacterium]|nr:acyl-ACP--UDP-N-acetylglucosamine O-acyltransferase [Bernardetiaceae bacterium]
MKNPLAQIDAAARIAKNVEIGPFSTIYPDVEIGEGTWIGPNVTIMDGARIGKNCKIYPGAVISAPPQDLKYEGEQTYTYIGDRTVVRECATVNRGTKESGQTLVGSDVLLMAYTHTAHDCVIGNHCIIVNAVQIAGHVQIGEYAILGGAAAVHQFVRIGAHVMIGGGVMVRTEVPPYVLAGHNPISYSGVNIVGLRRRGFDSGQIERIKEIYRYLFQSGLNYGKAIEAIEAQTPDSPERKHILEFVKASKRGIIKASSAERKD